MDGADSHDVVVVGAGAVGSAVARALAPDANVLLLDKTGVASEASGMAAGLTCPTLFAYKRPAEARHANEFLRSFSGTAGFTYDTRSRIELFRPEHESVARDLAAEMSAAGFPVSYRSAATLEERYASFDLRDWAGGVEIADAGFVDDTYVYTKALAADAERRGATVRTGVEVTGPALDGGALVGVDTASGTIEAESVVFAAGWRTRDLLSEVVSIPTRPFLLQAASMDPPTELDEGFPLGRMASESIYFRPQHNGRLRIGGGEHLVDDPGERASGVSDPRHVEDRMATRNVTAQEAVDDTVTDDFRDRAERVVPQFMIGYGSAADVPLDDGWRGVDAATGDGEPIIDAPPSAPDGLVVATGFNGLGITKSPTAAAAVRELVTGDGAPFDVDRFRLDRLPDSTGFELQDTFDLGYS